jgi:alkylhydroperoxidase family enzyme
MPHIHQVPHHESEGLLRAELDEALRRAGRIWNIVAVQSQNPAALRDSIRLYATLMFGESPLTRAQREMLAVVTSQVNDCFY